MPITLLSVLIFTFTTWLGLYLIARDRTKPVLVYTGLGLVGYAMGLVLTLLPSFSSTSELQAVQSTLLFVPALCWFGAVLHLLPEETLPVWLLRTVAYAILVLILIVYFVLRSSALQTGSISVNSGLFGWLIVGVIGLLLLAVAFVGYRLWRERTRRLWVLIFVLTLFFTLGAGFILLPSRFIPFDFALLAVGIDLLFLDFCIAGLDAFEEGETLLPDASYSFIRAMLAAVIFGGQVSLVAGENANPSMVALLFGVISAAIASQVFSESIQNGLDRLVFAHLPRLRRARSELRTAASLLPRVDDSVNLLTIPEEEFVRLTRRTLSHMTDPGKLAASPLMRLPMLVTRAKDAHTLERATQLKLLLAESIQRLKPLDKGDYGTTDEWRFYNVLYFPYVLGVKLLSHNYADHIEGDARKVADWFRANVPERTLHNWQNAAARLVAKDLLDHMR